MEYPLINKYLLSELRLAHGIFNILLLVAFLEHARLGLKIRRARTSASPLPFPAIKRHRKGGPVFAVLTLAGYAFGIFLVLVRTGKLFENPEHLLFGTLLVLLAGTNVFLSARIKGQHSPYRSRHFAAGLALLFVFVVQVLLGIGILF